MSGPPVTHVSYWSRWEALVCYFLLQLAFIPFQVWRLFQDSALAWLAIDLLGQAATLAVLLAFPAGRAALFCREPLKVPLSDAIRWMIGVLAFSLLLTYLIASFLRHVPDLALGNYPAPTGLLHAAHLLLGVPMAAWLEEVVYRRLANRALEQHLSDKVVRVIASALVFAAIHWWTGIHNILGTLIMGILFMLCYLRVGALWPAVAAHALYNLYWFAAA